MSSLSRVGVASVSGRRYTQRMTPLERIRDLEHQIEQHRQDMAHLGRERAQVIRDWVAEEGAPSVAKLLKVTRQSIYRAMHHD